MSFDKTLLNDFKDYVECRYIKLYCSVFSFPLNTTNMQSETNNADITMQIKVANIWRDKYTIYMTYILCQGANTVAKNIIRCRFCSDSSKNR